MHRSWVTSCFWDSVIRRAIYSQWRTFLWLHYKRCMHVPLVWNWELEITLLCTFAKAENVSPFPGTFSRRKTQNTNEQNFRLHVLQCNAQNCSFGIYRLNSIISERYIGAKSLKLYLEISTLETNKLTNSKAKKDKEKRRWNKILDYFISTGNAHA